MKQLAIGLMSGTSLDGIDVVMANIEGSYLDTKLTMISGKTIPYESSLLTKIEHCMNPALCTAELISSVHFELAIAYSNAIKELCSDNNVALSSIDFIASHGQTIYHINETTKAYHQSSLQLGDGSVIANLCETTVVSNFRNADIAQGGCGAPLVPFADFVLFHNETLSVALQNIGGISNVTVLPKQCLLEDVYAFDTGPGNMMIDEAMKQLFQKPYDQEGLVARSGTVNSAVLNYLLSHPFLDKQPPKSTGREQFGEAFTKQLLYDFGSVEPQDMICTLTHFTAITMANSYRDYILPKQDIDHIIVSGGGSKNTYLMELFQAELPHIRVMSSNQVGMNSDYKEALAFIILANETLHHQPSSVIGATGAKQSTILGQISYFK